MTLEETLAELEALGNEKIHAHYKKQGAGDNQFGVRLGDIRKLAKKIKNNHELALELWETGNADARFLAVLLIKPKSLTVEEMDRWIRSVTFERVADWFIVYLAKPHPNHEELREQWMKTDHPMAARAGWQLTSIRAAKKPEGLDLGGLLDRIEAEMTNAPSETQWTMNFTLAEIGIHHPSQRERALDIGEKLGIYRDYPVSKGCTSPFAPIWINEMVSRQNK